MMPRGDDECNSLCIQKDNAVNELDTSQVYARFRSAKVNSIFAASETTYDAFRAFDRNVIYLPMRFYACRN